MWSVLHEGECRGEGKVGGGEKQRNSSSSEDEHELMENVREAKAPHRQALTQIV